MPKGSENIVRSFYAGLLALKEIPEPEPIRGRGGVWSDSAGLDLHIQKRTASPIPTPIGILDLNARM